MAPLWPRSVAPELVVCRTRRSGHGIAVLLAGGEPLARSAVLAAVQRAVAAPASLSERSWFVDALRCVERLAPAFTLLEVHAFEVPLRARHPANQHIRPKIRRQSQRLRDAGPLIFPGKGRYRRVVT